MTKSMETATNDVPGRPCVFPFTWEEVTYNECVDDGRKPWCATEVDTSGVMEENNYGFCNEACPGVLTSTTTATTTTVITTTATKTTATTTTATTTSMTPIKGTISMCCTQKKKTSVLSLQAYVSQPEANHVSFPGNSMTKTLCTKGVQIQMGLAIPGVQPS